MGNTVPVGSVTAQAGMRAIRRLRLRALNDTLVAALVYGGPAKAPADPLLLGLFL